MLCIFALVAYLCKSYVCSFVGNDTCICINAECAVVLLECKVCSNLAE